MAITSVSIGDFMSLEFGKSTMSSFQGKEAAPSGSIYHPSAVNRKFSLSGPAASVSDITI